jgi:uncharacterized membrane protein YkvA (DUF1232 family)
LLGAGLQKSHITAMSDTRMEDDTAAAGSRALARREAKVRRGFWPKVRGNIARVPFLDRVIAAYYATLDPRTSLSAKATLIGALAYFILPTDVIPDFIAGLGYSDDLAVLLAALQATRGYVREEHVKRARRTVDRLVAGGDVLQGDELAAEIEAEAAGRDRRD